MLDFVFFFYSYGDLLDLHSFPTRRSSDLFALGSAGAFLVIESREHAEARGAKPYARLSNVVADLAHRKHPGEITATRSEEHTSELQSRRDLVCRLLLEKKKNNPSYDTSYL